MVCYGVGRVRIAERQAGTSVRRLKRLRAPISARASLIPASAAVIQPFPDRIRQGQGYKQDGYKRVRRIDDVDRGAMQKQCFRPAVRAANNKALSTGLCGGSAPRNL